MKQIFSNLMNDEFGQDLIEYALVAGLVSLGCVALLGSTSTKIQTIFTNIGTALTNAA